MLPTPQPENKFKLPVTRESLYQGAILHTIVHALGTIETPGLYHEVGWDGKIYCLQDSMGARGNISFSDPNWVVGMFFNEHSPRNPYRTRQFKAWELYFAEAPTHLLPLAEVISLYILDNYEGEIIPVITGAIWGDQVGLVSPDPWAELLLHGGSLFVGEILNPSEAIKLYKYNYQLSDEQTALVISIFEKRKNSPEAKIGLSKAELDLERATDKGLKYAEEMLADIGIELSD